MSLSPNPRRQLSFYLETDEHLPKRQRMVFYVRNITVAERQQHEELDAKLDDADRQTSYRIAYEMLGIGIVGWSNVLYPEDHAKAGQPIPFDIRELLGSGALYEQELWYLTRLYPSAASPVKAELENLGSPQPVAPGQSAAPAKESA